MHPLEKELPEKCSHIHVHDRFTPEIYNNAPPGKGTPLNMLTHTCSLHSRNLPKHTPPEKKKKKKNWRWLPATPLLIPNYLLYKKGDAGDKGSGGTVGVTGPGPRPQGFIVVRHSQSRIIPRCAQGMTALWSGYSLLYTEGNEKAQHQDLGKTCSLAW